MTDLRARLAEVLAACDANSDMRIAAESIPVALEIGTAAVLFCKHPALARALDDAERVAALEAENAALKARLAGGVEVLCVLDYDDGWTIDGPEYRALLPLDGKRVIVVEAE